MIQTFYSPNAYKIMKKTIHRDITSKGHEFDNVTSVVSQFRTFYSFPHPRPPTFPLGRDDTRLKNEEGAKTETWCNIEDESVVMGIQLIPVYGLGRLEPIRYVLALSLLTNTLILLCTSRQPPPVSS